MPPWLLSSGIVAKQPRRLVKVLQKCIIKMCLHKSIYKKSIYKDRCVPGNSELLDVRSFQTKKMRIFQQNTWSWVCGAFVVFGDVGEMCCCRNQ